MMIKLFNNMGKPNYAIHVGDYKRRIDPNTHTYSFFMSVIGRLMLGLLQS